LTNAIADKQQAQKLSKTIDNVKEVTDKYEDLKEISEEDVQTIGESLGLNELEAGSENFKFVKDNMEIIEKAINGDIEAMQELQGLLSQQMELTIDATTGFVDMEAVLDATGKVK
jgi:hypothetical protein